MVRRSSSRVRRSLPFFVLTAPFVFLLGAATVSATPCEPAGADAAAVAAAHVAVNDGCDCAAAASHREHVACARGVLEGLAHHGRLRRACLGTLQRRAARSTCGRPGAVTCCRTRANGTTRGSIRADAAHCRSPLGGSACVGSYPSVFDACDADGCAPRCGNGIVEEGERCDGQVFCDPACQFKFTLCCSSAPAGEAGLCVDADVETYEETCLANGLGGTPGTVCEETGGPCPPGVICAGACQPSATFPPTTLCCQGNGACGTAQVSDTVAIFQFADQCLGEGLGMDFLTGTCDPSGTCIPGG
jgi:hypothetical protein